MERQNYLEQLLAKCRPEIQALRAYEPEAAGPRIRLDANESPFDMPREIKQNAWESIARQAWNRYPDPECRDLRRAVADYEGITPAQVLMGNGSDEIIRDLLIAFGSEKTQVVFPSPTFSMYEQLTRMLGCRPLTVPLAEDWSLDMGAMLSAVKKDSSQLVFVASPNNPTGQAYPTAQLEELLKAARGLVIVDEAYRLFSNASVVSLLPRYPQLAVLCTYSKSMSAAGLRIGYLLAQPQVIEWLNRVRLPYNLDTLSQAGALAALQHPELWRKNAEGIIQERQRMSEALGQLSGIVVYPSQANFILIRVPEAQQVKQALGQQGIAVRGFSQDPRLSECLRVTIGLKTENDEFCRQLALLLPARKG